VNELSFRERFKLTLSLWPWGMPLILVYFAEYAMQSGTWSSIGFPVTDEAKRDSFYQYANWCYQAGVLVSRSSGTVWRPKLPALWVMPMIQMVLLGFSTLNGSEHWWYVRSERRAPKG
jgi:battenin